MISPLSSRQGADHGPWLFLRDKAVKRSSYFLKSTAMIRRNARCSGATNWIFKENFSKNTAILIRLHSYSGAKYVQENHIMNNYGFDCTAITIKNCFYSGEFLIREKIDTRWHRCKFQYA